MPRPRLSLLEWDCAQRVFQLQRAEEIRSFLQTCPKCIHHTNNATESALIYAITNNNTILAEILLDMGANLHDGCHWKNIQHSPLFVALATHRSRYMVNLLLQHGAMLNRDINGMSILERFVRHEDQYGPEALQYILDLGADPNRFTTWTDSNIRLNSKRRMGKQHNYLSDEHVQHYPKLRESGSYLMMAIATSKLQSANILLQHPSTDVTVRDSRGRCALFLAIEQNLSMEWIHTILGKNYSVGDGPERTRSRDCGGDFPLELAVRRGKTEIVRLFLQKGADPFQRISQDTCSVFALACSTAGVPVIFEFIQAHPNVCLRRDATETEVDDPYENPLHFSDDDQSSEQEILHEGREAFDDTGSLFPLLENQDNDGSVGSTLYYCSCHSQFGWDSCHAPAWRGSGSPFFEWETVDSQPSSNNDDSISSFFTCTEEFQ